MEHVARRHPSPPEPLGVGGVAHLEHPAADVRGALSEEPLDVVAIYG